MSFLYTGSEWSFQNINDVYDACDEIATEELKLNLYKNQLEIISSEQMLDAYASTGLPIMYKHWSFGKHFSREEKNYRTGRSGLAYEIVINSNPCINYLMEENTMTTQAAVIAHAAFGHNHFFKNNYLFKEWTNADHIIDYLIFARDYIAHCEEHYGAEIVEKTLNSCHAIMNHGIDRYKRPSELNIEEEKDRQTEREEYLEKHYNILWETLPNVKEVEKEEVEKELAEPEENLLYFLEKNSPILETWQREICRIVRKLAQYFYPQYQTKIMNEGWATFTHFYIMNRLFDKQLINEGSMLEFLKMHTNVITQYDFDHKAYSGFNPYYVGFKMFMDIKRICEEPTTEDAEWFPEIVGKNWIETLQYAAHNYRDESFIRQHLSPKLIRDWKLFVLRNNTKKDYFEVSSIHDDGHYKEIRKALANSYEISNMVPDIQIDNVNLKGDRAMTLVYKPLSGKMLNNDTQKTIEHVKRLWGYDVIIVIDDEYMDTTNQVNIDFGEYDD